MVQGDEGSKSGHWAAVQLNFAVQLHVATILLLQFLQFDVSPDFEIYTQASLLHAPLDVAGFTLQLPNLY